MVRATDDWDRRGYIHESCFYRSDDELLGVVVPFLEEGRRAGEATLVNLDGHHADLVRAALDDPDDVVFAPQTGRYATPAATIKQYLELFDSMLSGGARQIRAVGEIPRPGVVVAPWEPWARYEAAANRAYAEVPVWGICTYDLRSTPDDIVDDVLCTHPCVVTPDGRHDRNPRFEDPATWLARRPPPAPLPVERTAPAVELHDPWPHEARQAVEPLASHLAPGSLDDLATSVSEVVANARAHGVPPTVVRAWTDADRVVVTVLDRGSGPSDPFAGLLPPERELGDGGLGLWIAHQLCSDVAMARTEDGFRIRIVAGAAVSG